MSGTKTYIAVGGILERDGEYLLVQEAQEKCRGKWSIPAGALDVGETLIEGMKREVYEESGFSVEPTGICQIGNKKEPELIFASVIFTTKIKSGEIKFDPEEILDAKWFSYEEIVAMANKVRDKELVTGAINNARTGKVVSLDILATYCKK